MFLLKNQGLFDIIWVLLQIREVYNLIEYFLTVGGQIVIMFLMVAAGYIMYKKHMLSETGIKEISVLLMKVVTPIILMTSFQREFDFKLFGGWTAMFGISALTYVVSIAISQIVYGGKRGTAEDKMSIFLSNNGFLAFPLMQALAGQNGIFFGSTNVVLLCIIQWTYGLKLLKPDEKISLKRIFVNPGMIGVVLGLLLFFSPIKLPYCVFGAAEAIASLNTPLAMIVLGGLLAQTDLKAAFKEVGFYKAAAVKLLIVPAVMLPLIKIIPMAEDMRVVALICSVTPAATAVSMMSQLFDGNYRRSAAATVIMTILSAFTMPVILSVGKVILGY